MIRCCTVRNTARSTGNSNLRSARRSSITDRQKLSRHSLSKRRGGPIRLGATVVVSPFSTADSSIPLSVHRAPERNSRSSSPVSLSASRRPNVATTVWRGLPLTRWLSTIWRYSKPPDRFVRKYMPATVASTILASSPTGQGKAAAILALRKRTIPGFATAECGFQPHFGQVTVKVRYEENQWQLMVNQNKHKGVPRGGPSLLAGLLYCGRCGSRMVNCYPHNRRDPPYH